MLPYHLALTTTQKSSWGTVISLLQSDADAEAKLFAAITLRGKVSTSDSGPH